MISSLFSHATLANISLQGEVVSNVSGFLVQSFAGPMASSFPMKVVDLGECEITQQCELGNVRAAWAHWRGTSQWSITQTAKRVVLIEGQPDRLPYPDESVETWLEGRSGSFRGFELAEDPVSRRTKVLVFTDPLCTRPVYYLISDECVCISDKLSTVVINSGATVEPDWGGLLEAAVLGSLYSHQTTVKNAVWLGPGEALEFERGQVVRRWKNVLPADADLSSAEVMAHPAATLQSAIQKAIQETWTDPETRLLLSGGLDSRILLALASGKRKALTFELYSSETQVTRQVAAVSEADLKVVPAPNYEFPMRWAYLATGAMHDSRFVTHLGLVQDWRKHGIGGVTHGYFHNTMYRGWTAGPFVRYPNQSSILFEWMGRNAYYFDKYDCKPLTLPRQFYGLLSEDGKAVLRRQMAELSDSMVSVIVDGYDLTFERRLMDFVPRQVYFGVMLGWYEGVDVASPVFQPALWSWYALSRPRHRDRDWAIREVFLSLDHAAAKLPDSNTGQPIAHLKADWRDRIRNQFWYPPFRAAYQKLFWKPMPYQEGGMRWGSRFREAKVFSALEDGVGVLRDNPLFNRASVQAALDAYRSGDNQLVDAICALTAIGQWQRLVSHPEGQTQQVRVFQTDKSIAAERRETNPTSPQMFSSGESARV